MDAINNLYNAGKITAAPFPRPTVMPHFAGGIVYAPQRSLYLRRDGGDSWHLYVKSTAATVNTGWLALPGQEFDYAQITANLAGIAATTEAASQAVIAGNSVYSDGSPVRISFLCRSCPRLHR